ncbi:hypothetical protein CsSME_00002869 [Camellia sinensis var. sinensis]
MSSHTPCAISLNSTSALDLATTFCFLLLQVTRLLPTKVQYPEVDLLSVTDPPSQHLYRLPHEDDHTLKIKTLTRSRLQVPQNSHDSLEVNLMRSMYKLDNHTDSNSNIWTRVR